MLDHHDDIVSDLRVLCAVADWRALPGSVLFPLIERLPFYPGALRGRALAVIAQGTGGPAEGAVRAAAPLDESGLQRLADEGWIERD